MVGHQYPWELVLRICTINILHAKSLTKLFIEVLMCLLQGKTGNPFFDCVGMNSGAVPFKSFVQANGNNAKTLANQFVSYLQGGLTTKVGPQLAGSHTMM